MRLLLDTHILLWAAAGELSPQAARYVEDMDNMLYFSAASIWEVAIKRGLGKANFNADPATLYGGLIASGYMELPIIGRHTLLVAALPNLHKDPIDRILLAQAAYEGMPLLTSDAAIARYPGSIIYIPV